MYAPSVVVCFKPLGRFVGGLGIVACVDQTKMEKKLCKCLYNVYTNN